ncbi:MAG TPA: hypothetical protein V6D19_13135 [Stenomitos sp.]
MDQATQLNNTAKQIKLLAKKLEIKNSELIKLATEVERYTKPVGIFASPPSDSDVAARRPQFQTRFDQIRTDIEKITDNPLLATDAFSEPK